MAQSRFLPVLLPLLLVPLGCRRQADAQEPSAEPAAPITNRIDVPEMVRQNLGIRFVAVERRAVQATMRLAGHFELLPDARRHHHAPLAGRVTLHVAPLATVAPGDLLATIDAPEWRATQERLVGFENEVALTRTRLEAMPDLLAACAAHETSLRAAESTLHALLERLRRTNEQVGGQAQRLAEVEVELARIGASLAEAAERHTETETRQRELTATLAAASARFDAARRAALATLADGGKATGEHAWRTADALELRATAAGVVEQIHVHTGAWLDGHQLVLTTTDATAVLFRARALQSDLSRLRDGAAATVVPAGEAAPSQSVHGALRLGPAADPRNRTLDVFVVPTDEAPFARGGVAGFVEVTLHDAGPVELTIPRAAVLPDGLERVFFRRDPNDPDKVIRVTADLGHDDGRWIEVRSGLVDGDQVVLDGAYELLLASSRTSSKGGHFHADGSFHEDHE
jgi:multidrug efflux pump subunit AcrA (membrane-fusion protein)